MRGSVYASRSLLCRGAKGPTFKGDSQRSEGEAQVVLRAQGGGAGHEQVECRGGSACNYCNLYVSKCKSSLIESVELDSEPVCVPGSGLCQLQLFSTVLFLNGVVLAH